MQIADRKINGYLRGSVQDQQSVTKDWESLQPLIEGVELLEMKSVLKDNAYLTEIYREDWNLKSGVRHVFQEVLNPYAITAWHLHEHTTDRLFVGMGALKIVLYDAREGSKTQGLLNVFRLGSFRPGLVVIPPGIWHGIMNIAVGPTLVINLTDQEYEYEGPDHWRLPLDTDQIPYRFSEKTHGDF